MSYGHWILNPARLPIPPCSLAERVGVEPTVQLLTTHALSKRAPSASRTSLLVLAGIVHPDFDFTVLERLVDDPLDVLPFASCQPSADFGHCDSMLPAVV